MPKIWLTVTHCTSHVETTLTVIVYTSSLYLCAKVLAHYHTHKMTLTVNVYTSSLYLYAEDLAHCHTHEMTLTVNVYTSSLYLNAKVWLTLTHMKPH